MKTLENKNILMQVRPDLGGRIDSLKDLVSDREWLYHSSSWQMEQTRSLQLGASFDEHWTGGWDEIFPNDAAGDFQGRQLVDHGELWSQPWTVIEQTQNSLQMYYECQTVPVSVKKSIVLDEEKPSGMIRYMFRNRSGENVPFLFKMHCALAVEAGDQILLPECKIEPVDIGFSRMIGRAEKTSFPKAYDKEGKEIDVSQIPERNSETREFYYGTEISEGRCGVLNQRTQTRFVMEFDRFHFPTIWNFQSYGGWNGHYMAVIEPCTTIPWDLNEAVRNKTCAVLRPFDVQERRISFSLEKTH